MGRAGTMTVTVRAAIWSLGTALLAGGGWLFQAAAHQEELARIERVAADGLAAQVAPSLFTDVSVEDRGAIEVRLETLSLPARIVTSDGRIWGPEEGSFPVSAPIAQNDVQVGRLELQPPVPPELGWVEPAVLALSVGGLVGGLAWLSFAGLRRRWAVPLRRVEQVARAALQDPGARTEAPRGAGQALDQLLERHQGALAGLESRLAHAATQREELEAALARQRSLTALVTERIEAALVVVGPDGRIRAESRDARAILRGDGDLVARWRALDPAAAKRLRRELSQGDGASLPGWLRTEQGRLSCCWEVQADGWVLTLDDELAREAVHLAALHDLGWVTLLEEALRSREAVRAWLTAAREVIRPLASPDGQHPREVRALARNLAAGAERWGLEDLALLAHRVEVAARGGPPPAGLRRALGACFESYAEPLDALLGPGEQEPMVSLRERLSLLAQRAQRRRPDLAVKMRAPAAVVPAGVWERVEPLVWALVDNALEHAWERAAGVLTLVVSPGTPWTVEVEDDGGGVDWSAIAARACDLGLEHAGEDALDNALFTEGVSADPDQPERGAGLPFVREQAALMGGRVRLSSQPGQGTQVAVEVEVEA